MQFVSAEWYVDPIDGTRVIKATGDDDSIWWVQNIDSDVPPWPQFIVENGAAAIKQPPQVDPDGV